MERIIKLHAGLFMGFKSLFRPRETARKKINCILVETNTKALNDDWVITGDDIIEALKRYEANNGRNEK